LILLCRVPRPSSAWAGIFLRRCLHHGKESHALTSPHRPLRFNFHCPRFAAHIVTKAAPFPVVWPRDQHPLHWIPMNIAQLLQELALAPDIEIVVASLPEGIPQLATPGYARPIASTTQGWR